MMWSDTRWRYTPSGRAAPATPRFVRLIFFSSRRRHTRCLSDWSSDVCSSDLYASTDPSRPFAQQFSIQNVSAYTIRDIWPLCGFGYDSGFNLRGLSLAGSMVDRLEPGAKTTLACSIATGPIRTDIDRPVKPFWGAEILVLCFLRRGRACNVDRKSTRLNSSHLGISYAV